MASGAVAKLSLAALRHGEILRLRDTTELAGRLYYYNRAPAAPHWARRLSNPSLAAAHGGLPPHEADQALAGHWFRWPSRLPAPYKLYVSPACEHLAEALGAARALRPAGLKVGACVYNLVRPDKLMAYFTSLAELQEAAARLATALQGCPPHGVPFTAEIAGGGLLSWGVDRPRTSWRRWLTWRLATAMLAAPPACGPARFALEQIRAEGIDPDPWSGMQ